MCARVCIKVTKKRIWMLCYVLSTSFQLGKPKSTIKKNNNIIAWTVCLCCCLTSLYFNAQFVRAVCGCIRKRIYIFQIECCHRMIFNAFLYGRLKLRKNPWQSNRFSTIQFCLYVLIMRSSEREHDILKQKTTQILNTKIIS